MKIKSHDSRWNTLWVVTACVLTFLTVNLYADGSTMNQEPATPEEVGSTDSINFEERLNALTKEFENFRKMQVAQNESVVNQGNLPGNNSSEIIHQENVAPVTAQPIAPASSPKPTVEVHGMVRIDAASMDRVPQFGNIVQPATIQVPLDKQTERRHAVSYVDARWSVLSFDVNYKVCNTKIFGRIEFDYNTLDGSNLITNSRHNRLRHAYIRGDFCNDSYIIVGQTWDLITVLNIAMPLAFPICEYQSPAGMAYSRQPLIKIGGVHKLCNGRGEIDYFVGLEQQSVWTGVEFNSNIALAPDQGEPYKYPLFAAGVSWEKWEPLQVDARFGFSQNRFAVEGTRKRPESLGFIGKLSVQSQIWGPTLYASYTYMDGMNRFAFLSFPDSVLTENDHIKNVKGHGLYAGTWFDVYCGIKCNTMFGWAWAKPIANTSFSGDMYNQYRTGQICFWREFWGSFAAATEYKRWQVKACNGDTGHMNVYMATLFFYF